jgi:Protein of unknown function (DUF4231)
MTLFDADAYLKDRLNQQLTWLSTASRANKRTFLRLRILEILLGTGITIFSPFATRWGWGPLAIAFAGGGIAVSGSLLALNRHQENWLRYRGLAEALKREKYLFLTGTPPYEVPSTAFPRLVTACESLLSAENSHWSQQMSQQSEVSATQPGPPAQG